MRWRKATLAPPCKLELADGLPTLNLDRTRMRLLLRNLLDNALRHSAGAPQPPVLRVAWQGQGVAFTVRDHGPGVPADALPHLAEPFYRPDTARRARHRRRGPGSVPVQAGGPGAWGQLCAAQCAARAGSGGVATRFTPVGQVLLFKL
jgi:signal transduction histidine kinase